MRKKKKKKTQIACKTSAAAVILENKSNEPNFMQQIRSPFLSHIRVQVVHYEGVEWRRRWGWEQEEFPAKCAIK